MNRSELHQNGTLDETNPVPGEIREGFCGACASIPLAFAGAGLGAYGNKKNDYQQRQRLLVVSAVLTILGIFGTVYFLKVKKCSSCIAPSASSSFLD